MMLTDAFQLNLSVCKGFGPYDCMPREGMNLRILLCVQHLPLEEVQHNHLEYR